MAALRCSKCDVLAPPGADRCPKCLRKSTLVGPGAEASRPKSFDVFAQRAADERKENQLSDEGPQSYAGVRAAVLFGAWALYAPLVVLALSNQAWLEPRGLWLPAAFGAMVLSTFPLRMAFAAPDLPLTSAKEAARVYAYRQATVPAMALGFFAANALAGLLVADPVFSILLGLFFFLGGLLGGLAFLGALKKPVEPRQSTISAAKGFGLAAAMVLLCALVVGLRAGQHPPPREIVIPDDPKALLDPLDLESVRVFATWLPEADGSQTLHLRADAGDFKRTFEKLSTEGLLRVSEVERRAGASGAIHLWLPARFASDPHERTMSEREKEMNDTLSSLGRSAKGRPIRVVITFGEPPPRH